MSSGEPQMKIFDFEERLAAFVNLLFRRKKSNKLLFLKWTNFKLFILVAGLSFRIASSQTLPVNGFHVFPSELDAWGFSPNCVVVGVNHHLYFLDSINKLAVSITPDNNTHVAELSQDGLYDPVDIVQYGLSVWILNRMDNKLFEYDLKLNLIRTHEIQLSYPEKMTVDSNGNIYVISNQIPGVWKNLQGNKDGFPFIDLEIFVDTISDIVDLKVSPSHQIALLDEDGRIHIFNRIGKYAASNLPKISNPSFVFWGKNGWAFLNNIGELQTTTGKIIHLNISDEPILDITIRNNTLFILTSEGWWNVHYKLSISN